MSLIHKFHNLQGLTPINKIIEIRFESFESLPVRDIDQAPFSPREYISTFTLTDAQTINICIITVF